VVTGPAEALTFQAMKLAECQQDARKFLDFADGRAGAEAQFCGGPMSCGELM
jgi:hypothetical protein